MKVELDLSNYATKAELENLTGVDTSKFAKKVDLASLKSNVDKLDIDKLKNVPTNLSNLKSKIDKLDIDKSVPLPVDYNTKISEIENKITIDHDHDKYITAQEFHKLTSENVTARLAQANLVNKSDIANFVKKTDFDNKLKNFTSNKNELNKLSKTVKVLSTKELKKDLINKFSILNGAKYFSSGIFQSYLVFIPDKKYIKCFGGTTRIDL